MSSENILLIGIHLVMLSVFWFIHKRQFLTGYRATLFGLWLTLVHITYYEAGMIGFAFSMMIAQNYYLVDLRGKLIKKEEV